MFELHSPLTVKSRNFKGPRRFILREPVRDRYRDRSNGRDVFRNRKICTPRGGFVVVSDVISQEGAGWFVRSHLQSWDFRS